MIGRFLTLAGVPGGLSWGPTDHLAQAAESARHVQSSSTLGTGSVSSEVVIIVVTYESERDITHCLESILTSTLKSSVIVVDNASKDGTVDLIRRQFPEVTLIVLPENTGFAAACNRGILASTEKYCVFLNPDACLSPETIENLIHVAEQHPFIGILGPRVLDEDGVSVQPSYRSFPTTLMLFFHRFSILNRIFPNNPWRRRYLLLERHISEPTPVDWVSGCCMLVRRHVLNILGGFDEQFFLYSEDVDLCLRARQAGWLTYYNPWTSVTHRIGGSTRSVRPLIERHRSIWRYYRKHLWSDRVSINTLILLALTARCSALVVKKACGELWRRVRLGRTQRVGLHG